MKGCKNKMGKYNRNYNNFNDEFAKDMEAPVETEPVVEVETQAPVEEPAPVVEASKPEPIAKPEPKKEVKVEPKKKSNTSGIVTSKGPARL